MIETGAREEDIVAMEAQVRQAEAGLELARSTADTRSWEKDIEMAQAGYDQAKAGLDTAKALEKAKSWEAEITAAETGLKQTKVALELAKEMLSNSTITAPIDGIISKRFMDKGDMATPGMPLFTIVDMDKVKAVVDVTEANIAKISTNKEAYINVEAFPEEQIEGKISLISPTLKPMNRTVSVEITIDNPLHKLRPGMFAKVTIPVKVQENTIVIRRSAVLGDSNSGDRHLFVLNGNTVQKRNIQTGIARSDSVEILSGVKSGEKVVVSGQNYLKDGEAVTVVKTLQ